MQRGQSKFLFSYDAAGNAVSVKFNGTEYYYLRNAQGDIVKLIDANGTSVVEYTYDTWGKKVTTTGALAGTLGLFQPFRYRGYVYDFETGFYYLQSRYYDPTVGRFISADVLLSTGQGVLGHNCYAYCLGNPVNMVDISGSRPVISVNVSDGGGWRLVSTHDDKPNNSRFKSDSYIYSQKLKTIFDLSFGWFGTVGDNGCGLVALYNAIYAGGLQIDFYDLCDDINEKFYFYTLLGGKLGFSPFAMSVALKKYFDEDKVKVSRSTVNGTPDIAVFCYLYSDPIGGHYFTAVREKDNTYHVYNQKGFYVDSLYTLDSIYNFFSDNNYDPIAVWSIWN